MTLAELVLTIRAEPRRRLSDTPQARWNRANADRLRPYKRNWKRARRAKGLPA